MKDKFLTVGASGVSYSSPDAIEWTRSSIIGKSLNGIVWGNNLFVAVGNQGSILTSLQGTTWTDQSAAITNDLSSVAYGAGRFVAVGNGAITTSINGTEWTPVTGQSIAHQLNAITYGNGRFVAVGNGVIFVSSDGLNWQRATNVNYTFLTGVANGNNQFIAVGYGAIFTSPDGINWTKRPTPITNPLLSIAFGNGQFVAVSDYGHIINSTDGITWMSKSLQGYNLLSNINYGDGKFVANRHSGEFFISEDVDQWVRQMWPGYSDINAVAFGAGRFIGVGISGAVVRSSVSSSSALRLIAPTYDCATGNFQFNSSGGDGSPIEYRAVPGITDWTTNPSQSVDQELRTVADAPPIVLQARQNGREVSYLWNIRSDCPGSSSGFSISNVRLVKCETISSSERHLTFTPQYTGLSGQPVSFSVVNEMLPTVVSGPYTLRVYTDNPVITLSAQQGSAVARYSYNWLAVCQSPARLGSEKAVGALVVKLLGNPVVGQSAEIEISGVSGQAVQLKLADLQGKLLNSQNIEEAGSIERVNLRLGNAQGTLLLDVITTTQRQQIKLLRP